MPYPSWLEVTSSTRVTIDNGLNDTGTEIPIGAFVTRRTPGV